MGKGKNHIKTPTASKAGGSNGIKKVKGENFYRDAKSASRVKMLNGGKAVRDKDGKIIQAAAFQKGEKETDMGRIQADRRWFGEFTSLLSLTIAKLARLRQHASHLPDRIGSLPYIPRRAAREPVLRPSAPEQAAHGSSRG